MSTISLSRNADVIHHEAIVERFMSLFSRLFRPAPARSVDTSDVWALYSLTRGMDTVSPAVEQRLADFAAR